MDAYKITLGERMAFAASAADATATRRKLNAAAGLAPLARAGGAVVAEVEIPTKKRELLNFLNVLVGAQI